MTGVNDASKILSAASPVVKDVMPSPSVAYCSFLLLFFLLLPPNYPLFMVIFNWSIKNLNGVLDLMP